MCSKCFGANHDVMPTVLPSLPPSDSGSAREKLVSFSPDKFDNRSPRVGRRREPWYDKDVKPVEYVLGVYCGSGCQWRVKSDLGYGLDYVTYCSVVVRHVHILSLFLSTDYSLTSLTLSSSKSIPRWLQVLPLPLFSSPKSPRWDRTALARYCARSWKQPLAPLLVGLRPPQILLLPSVHRELSDADHQPSLRPLASLNL